MSNFETYQRNRLRSSYFYVVISIALVLFVLGLLGILVLQTKALSKHFKEQVTMNIFLNDNIDTKILDEFKNSLNSKEYVKKLSFISKDSAAKLLQTDLGEDFLSILDTNPLKDNLELNLNESFVNKDSISKIRKELASNAVVYEISYNETLVEKLDNNIHTITFWVLLLSAVLGLIAILLINSTIRLSVYSKRFTIKTMQMVGATKGFIRKPFIIIGIKLGVFGALIAIISLYVLAIYFEKQVPDIEITQQYFILVPVFIGILILGVIITSVSTYFATRKFLNLRTEELYY